VNETKKTVTHKASSCFNLDREKGMSPQSKLSERSLDSTLQTTYQQQYSKNSKTSKKSNFIKQTEDERILQMV
jgi:hypothetical protein